MVISNGHKEENDLEDAYVLQLLKPKFKDFYLCFCGFSECEPLHCYGPASRPNYILHYVTNGKGIYQVGEKRYTISQGQAFLIEPENLTFYQADKENPWSYLWVGFGGTDAPKFLQDLGLNSRQLICDCEYGEELKNIVFSMLKHTQSTTENLYYLQGELYHFFSVLARGISLNEYVNNNKEDVHVQEAINYIKNHYSQRISVSDIAEHLALNRSYLYMIFKNSLGISPKDFLTRFRISRGKEQLVLTELSIEEIALDCGYSNALIFGRAFKQVTGMTPSKYRNTNRKDRKAHLIVAKDELEEYAGRKVKY